MVYPFPPEHIDWEQWVCPGVYTLVAILSLLIAMACKKRSRFVILCLLGVATLWFLLMLPRFQGAREVARRTQCRNNLHIIGVAIYEWHDEHERLPAPVFHEADGSDVSWRVRLAPFLGDPELTAGYDESIPWDDAANDPIARREPVPYRCSTNPNPIDAQQRFFTAYSLLTGDGAAFPDDGPLSFDDISDGRGDTLLLGEACGARIVWTEPRDVESPAEDRPGVNLPGAEPGSSTGTLSSFHVGGAFGLLADGHVRFISERVDPEVLRALLTADSGDRVGEF